MKRHLTDEEYQAREISIFETILPMKKRTKKILKIVSTTLFILIAALIVFGII